MRNLTSGCFFSLSFKWHHIKISVPQCRKIRSEMASIKLKYHEKSAAIPSQYSKFFLNLSSQCIAIMLSVTDPMTSYVQWYRNWHGRHSNLIIERSKALEHVQKVTQWKCANLKWIEFFSKSLATFIEFKLRWAVCSKDHQII